jgi:hypothetical protein
MVYYHAGMLMPRVKIAMTAKGLGSGYGLGDDLYPLWMVARATLHGDHDPYNARITRKVQIGIFGRPLDPHRAGDPKDQRMFPNPAFTLLLFWPVAEFSFEALRVYVVCLLVVLAAAGVWLWFQAMDWHPAWPWVAVAILLTLASYPGLEGIYAGQIGLVVTFLLAAAVFALQRSRFLFAGFLMALTTMKPQVTALVILYLLLWSLNDWRVRRGFWIGFMAAITLLITASLAVFPHWIVSWIETVRAYHGYMLPTVVREVLTNPLGPTLARPATYIITAASILFAIILAWRNRTTKFNSIQFWLTLSVLLAITVITILPGQAVYDHIVLVPAILLLIKHRGELWKSGRALRIVMSAGLLILLWPWISALILIALLPWIPLAKFGDVVFSFPLRAAAPILFVTLALLGWMWRLRRLNPSRFA